ncbi:MAG: membrane or secreted protein [Bacteroidota bacterium]
MQALITIILVGVAFLGLAIRLLIDRKAEFSGGSCQATPEGLKDKGISCGCGGGNCNSDK